jgi:hypothetical protein
MKGRSGLYLDEEDSGFVAVMAWYGYLDDQTMWYDVLVWIKLELLYLQ